MYIPISLFGITVAPTLFFVICGLLATILLILICGLLVFALLMWLARRGTALIERIGSLPRSARPLLKEAGRIVVDLDRPRVDQAGLMRRGQRKHARRVDRRLLGLRSQLLALEERLEVLARQHNAPPATPGGLLHSMSNGGPR